MGIRLRRNAEEIDAFPAIRWAQFWAQSLEPVKHAGAASLVDEVKLPSGSTLVELVQGDKFWRYKRWAVKAMVAQGRHTEAIAFAESCRNPWRWWVATARGVRGCHTQGRTVDEARRRIREALDRVFQGVERHSVRLPVLACYRGADHVAPGTRVLTKPVLIVLRPNGARMPLHFARIDLANRLFWMIGS